MAGSAEYTRKYRETHPEVVEQENATSWQKRQERRAADPTIAERERAYQRAYRARKKAEKEAQQKS